jgi:hypothetical protein
MPDRVRPTKRALDDLEISFPPLSQRLDALAHPLVEHAQRIPEEVTAGGAERIRELGDRVWFKTKTRNHRGAVGEVLTPERFGMKTGTGLPTQAWWLVAAGRRQADTANKDFYARIATEGRRAGSGSGEVSTNILLPTDIDYRRWKNERATLATEAIRHTVRWAIARSAQVGGLHMTQARQHRIGALVRTQDGETYLAVTAEGFLDHKVLAIILDAVPGVSTDDWQVEPGEVLGIQPEHGQFVFSTILSGSSLSMILEEIGDHFL